MLFWCQAFSQARELFEPGLVALLGTLIKMPFILRYSDKEIYATFETFHRTRHSQRNNLIWMKKLPKRS